MTNLQFGFIAPTSYLQPLALDKETFHLCLAHLMDQDPDYVDFYKTKKGHDTVIVLDNGGYELHKAGKPMLTATEMLTYGNKIGADYLVLPDYPGEPAAKTRAIAVNYANAFKSAGFGTFYVPQSSIGAYEELFEEFMWALQSPLIDYIGVSILSIPNAYGLEHNPLQRYTSRMMFMQQLNRRCKARFGLTVDQMKKAYAKRIHFLGMLDGPNEISLMETLIPFGVTIDTWDSSSPVWAGIRGVGYDNSPTGLTNGKIPSHVNFASERIPSDDDLIHHNMCIIQAKVDHYNLVVDEFSQEGNDVAFKFSEGDTLDEIRKYITSTYHQHYVSQTGEDQVQLMDLIASSGSDFVAFNRWSAIKYLSRWGKKEGFNRKDLLKAAHYIILLLSKK